MLRITWTKIPMIKFLFTVVLSSLVGLDHIHFYHNYFKTSSESKRILGDPPCKRWHCPNPNGLLKFELNVNFYIIFENGLFSIVGSLHK